MLDAALVTIWLALANAGNPPHSPEEDLTMTDAAAGADRRLQVVPKKPAVAPRLIVFDLDHTLISGTIASTPVQSMTSREIREQFIDCNFFRWFCETAHHHGHFLAIASFAEGDGSTDEELLRSILMMLDAVLPRSRPYLYDAASIAIGAGPIGKLVHIERLHQSLCPALEVGQTLLIDNDKRNTDVASTFALAYECEGSGFSIDWFRCHLLLQHYLGMSWEEYR